MEPPMKLKIFSVILLLCLFFSGCVILHYKFDKSLNSASGRVKIKGLDKSVVIKRDDYGVPFIDAKNESDLFFGAGYVMAEDRLWQMVMMSMAMQGRLSEIAGNDMVNIDIFLRTLNGKKIVTEAINNFDPKTLSILESFAKGVNAYLHNHENLPAEFILTGYTPEKWRPVDSLYVFGMLNLGISFNFVEELNYLILLKKFGHKKAAHLVPVYPDEKIPFDESSKLAEIDTEELLKTASGFNQIRNELKEILPLSIPASNNFAISGKKTKSGKSIIENDTHLKLMVPGAWMMIHLKCPGYEAAGVTVPGVPLVTIGYNGNIAWGVTMVMADSQDIFIEKMKKINGKLHYLYKKNWIPTGIRKETFKIKGEDPVILNIGETVHGPLLNQSLKRIPFPPVLPVQPMPFESKYGISLSWAMVGGNTTFRGFYNLGKSRGISEAKNAISGIKSIYLNFIYGDKDNISWQVSGAFPVRKKGNGMLPSPGWTGEYDWKGFLPFNELPNKTNPAEGYLATANHKTVTDKYPHHLTSSWYNPDRGERLNKVLGAIKNADTGDVIRLQFEQYSPMSAKIQNLIFAGKMIGRIKSLSSGWDNKRKKRLNEALSMIHPDKFDSIMLPESSSAAVMGAFMHTITREIFLDEFEDGLESNKEENIFWESFVDINMMSYSAPEDHLLYREESPFWDRADTKVKETRDEIIADALEKAILLLEEKISTNREKWKWGRLHTYHWKHEFTKKTMFFHDYFNRGPFPAGGDVHSLNVSTFSWGDSFDVWNIPAMRMIVDFGKREPLLLITNPGQSGNPSSSNYADMLPFFLKGKLISIPFLEKNIALQYKSIFHLDPDKQAD